MVRIGRPRRVGARVLAAATIAAATAACAPDRVVTGSTYPTDYRERHPIILTDASRTLDVFVNSPSGLDPRQRQDVRAFAAEYLRHGEGAIVAQLPTGTGRDGAAHGALEAIRVALAEGGMPESHLSVSTYRPTDPAMASPIRLSFKRLQAKVTSRCGMWPQDLGAGDYGFGIRNEPYWNLGCATQATVAAQLADPVDLVRGRRESAPDTVRRTKAIQSLREGKDPSTQYRDQQTKINQTVGN